MSDHFERLALPRRFFIDAAELERLYLARSREFHPDFHSLGSESERAHSLTATAAVNEAYLTLKDPFRRAEYLLSLLGGPTASAHKDMPQVFLMEMLDLREEIEVAKQSASTSELERIESELRSRYDAILEGVGKQFEQAAGEKELIAIRKELNAAKVLRGLLRDLHDRD